MLKKCLGIALTVIVLSGHSVLAQSYAETALLFSRTQAAGSARVQAMASAQIALGGDYSSALSNPAGLGMYNRSELTFSPALSFYKSTSNYDTGPGMLNPSIEESSSKFNIPGVSYVMNLPMEKGGYMGGSFGFSFSRINDFNTEVRYAGENEENSIVDYFLEQADGTDYRSFDDHPPLNTTELAYWNYLIGPTSILDPVGGADDEYFTDAPVHSNQTEYIKTSRSSNQWSLSYGGNYKDVFFFGGGIGLTSIRFTSEKSYEEQYLYDGSTDQPIDRMVLNEALDIRGSGINVALGVIARPIEHVQIGFSFTSPTFYQMTENYNARMDTYWNNFEYDDQTTLNHESDETGAITSEYNLTTPLKLSAGIALISKRGLISFDVEKVNPAKAKYTSDIAGISYTDENNEIQSLYKSVMNYRIGAEFRHKSLRVRGGYAFQSSTFENNDLDNSIQTISGGLGLRQKKFAVDLALISRKGEKSYYSPYSLADRSEPVAKLGLSNLTAMLTLSVFF